MLKIQLKIIFIITIFVTGCERFIEVNDVDSSMPPAVPVGLSIYSAYDGGILLGWQPNYDSNLKGYSIYRSINDTNFYKIAFTTNNYYYDDSLNYTNTYSYKITAVNIKGIESRYSNAASAKPLNLYPPTIPRYLAINARNWEGNLSVYLTWLGNKESDVKGYYIYRNTSPNFSADSSNLIGYSIEPKYIDSLNLSLYTNYYYKIKTVDKGGLLSNASDEIYDQIYAIPLTIFPEQNYSSVYFDNFIIKAISKPAIYRVILQTNQYFGEFWSKEFFTSTINDTLKIKLDASYLSNNTDYYWRVITFSNSNTEPNSISPLYKFTLKP